MVRIMPCGPAFRYRYGILHQKLDLWKRDVDSILILLPFCCEECPLANLLGRSLISCAFLSRLPLAFLGMFQECERSSPYFQMFGMPYSSGWWCFKTHLMPTVSLHQTSNSRYNLTSHSLFLR